MSLDVTKAGAQRVDATLATTATRTTAATAGTATATRAATATAAFTQRVDAGAQRIGLAAVATAIATAK